MKEEKEEKEPPPPREQHGTRPAEAPKPVPPPAIPPSSPAAAVGGGQPKKVNRFSWAKETLLAPLVGLAVQDEDDNLVAINAVRSFNGEAYIERKVGARARLVRFYDLAFELEFKAKS